MLLFHDVVPIIVLPLRILVIINQLKLLLLLLVNKVILRLLILVLIKIPMESLSQAFLLTNHHDHLLLLQKLGQRPLQLLLP
jgi:hypothetical protein